MHVHDVGSWFCISVSTCVGLTVNPESTYRKHNSFLRHRGLKVYTFTWPIHGSNVLGMSHIHNHV